MALKITKWDCIKILLCSLDIIIFLINIFLFLLIFHLSYKEYQTRSSFYLFQVPLIIGLINIIIDFSMNKINIIMKYAGHNRYGMITRFFMFYFVLTILIYTDQREKYIKRNERKIKVNELINFFGKIDITLIILSMILGFFIIDIQNFKQISVKKNKIEEMNYVDNLVQENEY